MRWRCPSVCLPIRLFVCRSPEAGAAASGHHEGNDRVDFPCETAVLGSATWRMILNHFNLAIIVEQIERLVFKMTNLTNFNELIAFKRYAVPNPIVNRKQ